MENEFNIGQEVFIGGNVKTYKVIKDFEFFGNLTLYYMDDMTAYPSDIVFYNSRMWFYKHLCESSVEERDSKFIALLENAARDAKKL